MAHLIVMLLLLLYLEVLARMLNSLPQISPKPLYPHRHVKAMLKAAGAGIKLDQYGYREEGQLN